MVIDKLEARVLLATQLLDHGTLIITGAAGDDIISVTVSGEKCLVDDGVAAKKQYGKSSVSSIKIDGGLGNDWLLLSDDVNIDAMLLGGDGDDTLAGGIGTDTFSGGDGNDTVDYSQRTAALSLSANGFADDGENNEADNIGIDVETMIGGAGNDYLYIPDFPDLPAAELQGGPGNDILVVSAFDVDLQGQDGNDTFYIYDCGPTAVEGGAGTDTVYPDSPVAVISLDDQPNDNITTRDATHSSVASDVEVIYGTEGDDCIQGGNGDERFYGGDGNDTLMGMGGSDTLFAGAGKDLLDGGLGMDTADYRDITKAMNLKDNNLFLDWISVWNADKRDDDHLVERYYTGSGDDYINFQVYGYDGQTAADLGVTGIFVDAGPGNDSFSMPLTLSTDGTKLPFTLRGGPGNDRFDYSTAYYPAMLNEYGDAGDDYFSASFASQLSNENEVANYHGGSGFDTLDMTYFERSVIYMTQDGVANDGAGKSYIDGDIEELIASGYEPTYMQGGDGPNVLRASVIQGDNIAGSTMLGGGGDDILIGGSGRDSLSGGEGDDLFVNADGSRDTINGGTGFDLAQPESIDSISKVEFSYDDADSTASAKVQSLFLARPLAASAPGAKLSSGLLQVNGTDGNDTIVCYLSGLSIKVLLNKKIIGTFGSKKVKNIRIDAGAGDDNVQLLKSSKSKPLALHAALIGGDGNDTLVGGSNSDSLQGDAGNDSLSGGDNPDGTRDILQGGLGNDTLRGGNGDDILHGGDDRIAYDGNASDGNDLFDGGAGSDTADYTNRRENLTLSINGLVDDGAKSLHEKDTIMTNIETIFAGQGDDTITGSSAKDLISAGLGQDLIHGGAGKDVLIGANNHDLHSDLVDDKIDTVYGDAGFDILALNDHVLDYYNPGLPGAADAREGQILDQFLDELK